MKVLLVDDHPLILAAMKAMLESLADDVVVLTVESARETHDLLAVDRSVDLVLLDLTLGDADGFSTLAQLREQHPDLSVVIFSATDHLADVVRAIDLGAMGFVPKRSSTAELHAALTLVMAGSVYIPPALLGLIQLPGAATGWAAPVPPPPGPDGASEPQALSTPAAAPRPPPAHAGLGLTPRQTDTLQLLLKGLSNKLIARELNLSVETVKDHVAAVLRALGVTSRTQAVLAVSRLQQQAAQHHAGPR